VCTREGVRLTAVLCVELDVDSNVGARAVVDWEDKDTGNGTRWEAIEDKGHKGANARDSPMG